VMVTMIQRSYDDFIRLRDGLMEENCLQTETVCQLSSVCVVFPCHFLIFVLYTRRMCFIRHFRITWWRTSITAQRWTRMTSSDWWMVRLGSLRMLFVRGTQPTFIANKDSCLKSSVWFSKNSALLTLPFFIAACYIILAVDRHRPVDETNHRRRVFRRRSRHEEFPSRHWGGLKEDGYGFVCW
jgi:hypothetical protein